MQGNKSYYSQVQEIIRGFIEKMATQNDITKDKLQSKPNNTAYNKNYDKIRWDNTLKNRQGKGK